VSINRHPPVHRWTEVEDSPYTGGPIGLRLSCAIAKRCWEPRSTRVARIRYTEPASSPPAGVTNLDQYRDL
jgi:hypothetical protein